MGALTMMRRNASGAHRNRPFLTDLTNGGRTEFTGSLFEQWVSKTANYLEAEFGTELQMHVELRAHWLWPVIVAALDELEGTVVPRGLADLQLRIGSDPESDIPVLAVHDHPMALPFREVLPPLHHDFFLEVRGGGDVRSSGPMHETPLLDDGTRTWTAAELVASTTPLASAARLAVIATDAPLRSARALASLTVLPWVSGASLVIADDQSAVRGEQITAEVSISN